MEQKSTFWKSAMIYGLYLGGISIVLSLIIWATSLMEHLGIFGSAFLGISQLILLVFLLIYFTKLYRDNELIGKITFGQAFVFGIIIVVCSTILSSIYTYVFNKYIDPEYSKRILLMIQDKTYQWMSGKGLSQDQIDSAMKKFEEQPIPTPIETLISSIKFGLIGGAIMSLISSAIVKKNANNEDAFEEAMEDVKTEE
jgi:uncharacterized membrane protein (DUF485 family)